jgi:hypothetical protein
MCEISRVKDLPNFCLNCYNFISSEDMNKGYSYCTLNKTEVFPDLICKYHHCFDEITRLKSIASYYNYSQDIHDCLTCYYVQKENGRCGHPALEGWPIHGRYICKLYTEKSEGKNNG